MTTCDTYAISKNGELHPRVDSSRLHTQTFSVRVRPEVVLRSIEGVRLERDAFAIAHADGLQQHTAPFEQIAAGTSRTDAVMETGNDARVDIGTWNAQIC